MALSRGESAFLMGMSLVVALSSARLSGCSRSLATTKSSTACLPQQTTYRYRQWALRLYLQRYVCHLRVVDERDAREWSFTQLFCCLLVIFFDNLCVLYCIALVRGLYFAAIEV